MSTTLFALQAYAPPRLAELLEITLPEARKIVASVHRDEPLGRPLPGVRRLAIEAAHRRGHVPVLEVTMEKRSLLDPFRKVVLTAPDGGSFEAVRIPLERAGRFSVCVSSQIGCALACAFCATGRLGLRRNLETWEIVEQVRVLRRTLLADRAGRVHGVVFQGMGEPLANLDRVLEAIRVLCDPSALAIDARAITVCTAGIPSGIRRLAREAPRVRLGLSISSARPDVRRSLMPIERQNPLAEVIDAAVEHARTTGLAPMWAITPLRDVNDGAEDAVAVAALARRFAELSGKRPRITLVPYNRIDDDAGDPFRRSDDGVMESYRAAMASEGFLPHVRYSGGGDVGAACGQLVAR
jgi:23S rRNA (adenine2503-C2)-methyltransferase